jgi:ubiquinone/menaquinone biosynthesis C-methylase UbiE
VGGSNLNPAERFSDRAENYARYRPGYPPELVEFFSTQLGLETTQSIADVGSGTGLLAELFLRHGNTVFCVEPNDPMRTAAEERLSNYPNFRSVTGRAEATTLADASVDFVTAAQAFHWFDPAETGKEFTRILKNGGTAALLWNLRRDSNTELARDYEALLQQHGRNYPAIKKSWYVEPETLRIFFSHSNYASETFYYADDLDFTALRGRFESASFAPRPEDDDYKDAVAELRRIFDRCQEGGSVKVEYDCRMYYGNFR